MKREDEHLIRLFAMINGVVKEEIDKRSDEMIIALKECSVVSSDLLDRVRNLKRYTRGNVTEPYNLREILLIEVERKIKKEMDNLPITNRPSQKN